MGRGGGGQMPMAWVWFSGGWRGWIAEGLGMGGLVTSGNGGRDRVSGWWETLR